MGFGSVFSSMSPLRHRPATDFVTRRSLAFGQGGGRHRMSIQFEQITKRYQGVPVVSDVTLEIAPGEFFVLLGPSGSGKSTILRAVAGLTGIDRGRISLHGRDVTH